MVSWKESQESTASDLVGNRNRVDFSWSKLSSAVFIIHHYNRPLLKSPCKRLPTPPPFDDFSYSSFSQNLSPVLYIQLLYKPHLRTCFTVWQIRQQVKISYFWKWLLYVFMSNILYHHFLYFLALALKSWII